MDDSYQNKIDEAMAKLSEESRRAINNVNWKLLILSLKKYTQDQLDDLEIETELLLCGITKPEDYPIELEDKMHLTKEDTISLIDEMKRLVFEKIEFELKKILEEKEKSKNRPINIDPRFTNLPKNVGLAIAQSGWRESLYEISKKYKLNIEQMGLFENDTAKLITNEIHTTDYENILSSDLNLSGENLKSLVNEVNEKIMITIRELLKEEDEKESRSDDTLKGTLGFDKIPLPPYSKIKSDHPEPIAPLRIKTEPVPVKQQPIPTPPANIPLNTEQKNNSVKEDLLQIPPKNIIEEKLSNLTMSDKNTQNINTNDKNTDLKSSDPYREPF